MKIVKMLDDKLRAVELSRVRIDEPVGIEAQGLGLITDYPTCHPKFSNTDRCDFGHGLMERLSR